MCLSAVSVGWTLKEKVKIFMQELVDVGVLLWKFSCRCLMLEGVLLQGEWLCEGLSVRCSREQFTVKG